MGVNFSEQEDRAQVKLEDFQSQPNDGHPYDLAGARAAGVPAQEILDHLVKKFNYPVDDAIAHGVSKGQIISHLASKTGKAEQSAGETIGNIVNRYKPMVNPANWAGGIANMVRHPLDTFENDYVARGENKRQAHEARARERLGGKEDPIPPFMEDLASETPLLGPMIGSMNNNLREGRPGAAVGEAAGAVTPMVAGPLVDAGASVAGRVGAAAKSAGARGFAAGVERAAPKAIGKLAKKGRAAGVVEELLNRGDRTDAGALDAARQRMAVDSERTNSYIHSTDETINPKAGVEGGRWAKGGVQDVSPTASQNAIDRTVNDFYEADRGQGPIRERGMARNLSAPEAEDIVNKTHARNNYGGDKVDNASVLADKGIAHQLNEALKDQIPGVRDSKNAERLDTEVIGVLEEAIKKEKKRSSGGVFGGSIGGALGGAGGALEGAVRGGLHGGLTGAARGAIAGTVGGSLGEIAVRALKSPATQQRLALMFYKYGDKLQDIGKVKGIVKGAANAVSQQFQKNNVPMPFGMTIHGTYNGEGYDVPTTPGHIVNAMASVIADGHTTFKAAREQAIKQFGEDFFTSTTKRGTKPLNPADVYKKAKVQLKAYGDVPDAATFRAKTDAGRIPDWYLKNFKKYATENRVPDADMNRLVNALAAASPGVSVDTAAHAAVGAYKLHAQGLDPSPALEHLIYQHNRDAVVAALNGAEASGPKVGPFAQSTNVLFGGEFPKKAVIDRHSAASAGNFPEKFTGGQRQFADARLRGEQQRLGLDRLDQAQAANWGGHTEGRFKAGERRFEGYNDKNYIDFVRENVDKHGGPNEVFQSRTDFDPAELELNRNVPDTANTVAAREELPFIDKVGGAVDDLRTRAGLDKIVMPFGLSVWHVGRDWFHNSKSDLPLDIRRPAPRRGWVYAASSPEGANAAAFGGEVGESTRLREAGLRIFLDQKKITNAQYAQVLNQAARGGVDDAGRAALETAILGQRKFDGTMKGPVAFSWPDVERNTSLKSFLQKYSDAVYVNDESGNWDMGAQHLIGGKRLRGRHGALAISPTGIDKMRTVSTTAPYETNVPNTDYPKTRGWIEDRVVADRGNREYGTPDLPMFDKRFRPEEHAKASMAVGEPGGGFTITKTGEQYSDGYSFAPSKETEHVQNHGTNWRDIEGYANKHRAQLEKSGDSVGGWEDEGKVYLDESTHEPETKRERALRRAKEARQKTIYAHKENRSIPVE